MRNNICKICGTEFEPREGKQYCSNACKQKSYSDKKQQIGAQQTKEQEIKIARKQFQFYYPEYEEYKSKYPKGIDSFLMYCFFRKNLTGVTSVEQVYNYINGFTRSWWDEFWDNWDTGVVSPQRKKYDEFQGRYFGDDIEISFSEQTKKSA
ncbi:MAG: hypothetical protein ACLQQ4_11685 [Bacteroidia bacterium]